MPSMSYVSRKTIFESPVSLRLQGAPCCINFEALRRACLQAGIVLAGKTYANTYFFAGLASGGNRKRKRKATSTHITKQNVAATQR